MAEKAEVYAKDVCELAKKQVGKSCGKTNEYSKELDAVKFYNYPKNGVADSCSIFVDDMVYRCTTPKTANNARAVLYEPNKDNCGAGCKQAAQYFKDHKAWISKPANFKLGDKIFFKKSNGALYHTGLVVGVGDTITTVEGNTNGGKVAQKTYKATDSKIAGAGRPKYTAYEKVKDENSKPETPVTPEPDKPVTPEPVKPTKTINEIAKEVIDGKWGNGKERADKLTAAGYNYKEVQDRVNELLGIKPISGGRQFTVTGVTHHLNVRVAPNGMIIRKLYNGDKVTVYEIKNGWGRIGVNQWVYMEYLK